MIVLRSGVVLRSGRNPFEVFLLGASALAGLVGALAEVSGVSASGVVAATLPRWAVIVWYLGLFVGASASLTGVAMHGLNSLLVERLGLLLLGGFGVVYASAVFTAAGWKGFFSACLVAAFAAANVWRFVQIERDLRRAEAMDALRPEDAGGES